MSTDDRLLQRFLATGKAESRYLYVLLLSAVFFFTVDRRLATDPEFATQALGVPALQLEFEAGVVWAVSPIIVGIMLLAVFGTLRATTSAWERMRRSDAFKNAAWEVMDTTPNLIDFAVFANEKTPRLGRSLALLSYPTVLTSVVILYTHLTIGVWAWNARPSWRWAILMGSAVMFVPITWRLVLLWRRKVVDIGSVWRGPQVN